MLNLAKKLFDLQALDLEIKTAEAALSDMEQRLQDDSKIKNIKQEYSTITDELIKVERSKKDLEWNIDELQRNINQINTKLYGGTVKNPKELMGFEQEGKALKAQLKEKEDVLLDLMGKEDAFLKQKESIKEKLNVLENEWQAERDAILADKQVVDEQLADLNNRRQQNVSTIDGESMKIYEKISSKKGYAVVKVEQGKCQGCRLSISMSEMQRARSGAIVQCSSCGMILYL
jgi:predicted  nucleic acid-binding Zn-ribbon protein